MGVILSEDNHLSVIIPAGFAHGFQAMQDNCELIYLHSEEYNQSAEFGVKYNDPILDIKWPLPCTKTSSRDEAFEYIKNLPSGLI
jgi:dTDP-4-dehydrorhamnose 3,5-epimerase